MQKYRNWLAVLLLASLASIAWAQGGPQSANIFEVPKDSQAERQQTQPGNNAPVWREVQAGTPQYTSVRGVDAGVLIQPPARFVTQENATTAGEAWRLFRNGPVTLYGSLALTLVVLAIALFYWRKGTIKLHSPPSGKVIERFTAIERTVHWTVAISFVILSVSGLVLLFGKHVLLPVIGYSLFAFLTQILKQMHNFVGPVFVLGLIVIFITFVRDNFPSPKDWLWVRKAGGLASGEHIPSDRFNAGEKVWFWMGVLVLGGVIGVSGLVLDFPNFLQSRSTMQFYHAIHVVGSLIFMCLALGHIYMGTIGMQGAYRAMRYGYVDETWAREHHEYWYNDVKAGKIPAVRTPAGREAVEQGIAAARAAVSGE
jgi:formate dehydrogenase subunit gamma